MIAHVGVVLATYLGLRLIEVLDKKTLPTQKRRPAPPVNVESIEGIKTADQSEPLPAIREKAVAPDIRKTLAQLEHRHQHFARAGMVTTGLVLMRGVVPGVMPIAGLSYLYTLVPQLRYAERSLLDDGRLRSDAVFITLNMITLGLGWYGSTALSLWMLHGVKASHVNVRAKLHDGASRYFTGQKNTLWTVKAGVELETPIAEVMEGDFVVISDGVNVPVNGVIREGGVSLNQYLLTGQTELVKKGIGAPVYANTVVVSGRAVIQVDNSKGYL